MSKKKKMVNLELSARALVRGNTTLETSRYHNFDKLRFGIRKAQNIVYRNN